MGLDYRTLAPYGGFDGLVEKVLQTDMGPLTATSTQDFAALLHLALNHGTDLATQLEGRGKEDDVLTEMNEGIARLGAGRAIIAAKLRRLFPS